MRGRSWYDSHQLPFDENDRFATWDPFGRDSESDTLASDDVDDWARPAKRFTGPVTNWHSGSDYSDSPDETTSSDTADYPANLPERSYYYGSRGYADHTT